MNIRLHTEYQGHITNEGLKAYTRNYNVYAKDGTGKEHRIGPMRIVLTHFIWRFDDQKTRI